MKDCTIRESKTKALISCAEAAQLVCAFVFAHAKIRVSHDLAQITQNRLNCLRLDRKSLL